MFKKFASICLALLMITALVGCGKQKRQIIELTLSTEDSEAILRAAGIMLPDVADTPAAGSTVKWLWDSDPFHNYAEDEIVNTGYFTFREKYGCEVEWIETTYASKFNDLANYVVSDMSPDFFNAQCNTFIEVFPIPCIKGMFQSIDDYMDYSDPLWSGVKDFADRFCSLNGKHYVICTDLTFGSVCAYNRRVIDEWGFEDPAELYYNNEWTWDEFYEMCVKFSDPDEDRYALDGWGFDVGLMDSSGAKVLYLNTETGQFEANLDDPRLERANNMMYNLGKNDCVYPWYDHGWTIRDSTEGAGIKTGFCLFYIRGAGVFTGPVDEISNVWGDVTKGELMFVPCPRDPEGDGNYYTETYPAGYAICEGAEIPEGVALLAACERFKVLDPTVISIDEKQLKETYLWTEEMLDMWDECYRLANSGNVMVGYGEGLQGMCSKETAITTNGHNADVQTWAQLKEANEDALQAQIDEVNKMIEDFIASGN